MAEQNNLKATLEALLAQQKEIAGQIASAQKVLAEQNAAALKERQIALWTNSAYNVIGKALNGLDKAELIKAGILGYSVKFSLQPDGTVGQTITPTLQGTASPTAAKKTKAGTGSSEASDSGSGRAPGRSVKDDFLANIPNGQALLEEAMDAAEAKFVAGEIKDAGGVKPARQKAAYRTMVAELHRAGVAGY